MTWDMDLTKRLCTKTHKNVTGETFKIGRDKNGLDAPDLSYITVMINPTAPATRATSTSHFSCFCRLEAHVSPRSSAAILAENSKEPVQSTFINRFFDCNDSPTGCTAKGVIMKSKKQKGADM
jgi:hypothetical protein